MILISGMIYLFLISFNSISQNQLSTYYFVNQAHDTTFCNAIEYRMNMRGYLDYLKYQTITGIPWSLQGKKNIPDIVTFYLNGKTLDKIPYKLGSKSKLYVYSDRVVNGKLIVYLDYQIPDQTVMYRFYIRFPDGVLFRINKRSDFDEIIKPFMLKCEDFNQAVNGILIADESDFIEAAKLYNFLCE